MPWAVAFISAPQAAPAPATALPLGPSAGYCAATGPQRVAPGAAIPPVPPARPRPGFLPGASAMLLCQVALGRAAPGSGGLRTAPQGYQSCMAGGMYTVYHSDQAYPTRVVHFK